MANFSRLQTGMYAERLIGRIDRHVMFCSIVYVTCFLALIIMNFF